METMKIASIIFHQIRTKMFYSKNIKCKVAMTTLNGLTNAYKNETLVCDINNSEAVQLASNYLKEGGVIALPTDTVYGLACVANNPKAVKRLYSIKGRENNKPVAICVADVNHLKYWGKADHLSDDLLNSLLPGPVTIILKKSHNLDNPYLNPGITKIGIRIPSFPFIQNICKKINLPLALTSANRSKEKSSLNIREFEELWPNINAVFDGGQLGITEEQRSASTVVDLSIPGKYEIVRNGIAVSKTIQILNEYSIINT